MTCFFFLNDMIIKNQHDISYLMRINKSKHQCMCLSCKWTHMKLESSTFILNINCSEKKNSSICHYLNRKIVLVTHIFTKYITIWRTTVDNNETHQWRSKITEKQSWQAHVGILSSSTTKEHDPINQNIYHYSYYVILWQVMVKFLLKKK